MKRTAFTLVELLVVIAIIGILLSLLIPAVQAARESARNLTCKNNIRQIALAFRSHESAHRHFAGDGWGWRWVGDPDRGTGWRQPGGWLYQLLPFTEEGAVAQLGRDGQPDVITSEQKQGLARATQVHTGWYHCPTRRGARLAKLTTRWTYINMDSPELTATTSYAVNWGPDSVIYAGGPNTRFMHLAEPHLDLLPKPLGMVFPISEIKARQVKDGLSKTYLVGDTFWWITPNSENPNGTGSGTPLSSYVANSAVDPPLRDMRPGPTVERDLERWGSAHPIAWNVAFCDGSVRSMAYDIALDIHRRFADRRDGQPIAGDL